MNLWEKIKQGVEIGASVVAEEVPEQQTEALELAKLQAEVEHLRNEIAEQFKALGGEIYVLYTTNKQDTIVDEIKTKVEGLETLREELEQKEQDLEKLTKFYEDQSISIHKFMAFKDELEASEGTMEHFVVEEKAPYIGMKLSEIEFPDELLMTLVSREGAVNIPSGDTEIKIGDKIVLVGKKEAVVEVLTKFRAKTE